MEVLHRLRGAETIVSFGIDRDNTDGSGIARRGSRITCSCLPEAPSVGSGLLPEYLRAPSEELT